MRAANESQSARRGIKSVSKVSSSESPTNGHRALANALGLDFHTCLYHQPYILVPISRLYFILKSQVKLFCFAYFVICLFGFRMVGGGGKKDLTKFCIGQKSLLNLMVVFRDFIYI